MFDRLGSRKYFVPVVIVIVLACAVSLMFWPMTHMQIKNFPFAILSLDEGANTLTGSVNAGDEIAEALLSEDDDDAFIIWHQVASENELESAFDNLEYYGALIVPENYTKATIAGQSNAGEPESLTVVIDNAKSPMAATLLEQNMGAIMAQMGFDADIEVIHSGIVDTDTDTDAASTISMTSLFSSVMGQAVYIAPLCLLSVICGAFLSRSFARTRAKTRDQYWKTLGKQAAYAAVLSLLVSLAALCLIYLVGSLEAPVLISVLFLWIAAFCLMVLFAGLCDISLVLGIAVGFCIIALGMACGMFPGEMLPGFWRDWIYPWVPQHYVGEGMRSVMYTGAGVWNTGSLPLVLWGIIGVVLMFVSSLKVSVRSGEAHEPAENKSGILAQTDSSEAETEKRVQEKIDADDTSGQVGIDTETQTDDKAEAEIDHVAESDEADDSGDEKDAGKPEKDSEGEKESRREDSEEIPEDSEEKDRDDDVDAADDEETEEDIEGFEETDENIEPNDTPDDTPDDKPDDTPDDTPAAAPADTPDDAPDAPPAASDGATDVSADEATAAPDDTPAAVPDTPDTPDAPPAAPDAFDQ